MGSVNPLITRGEKAYLLSDMIHQVGDEFGVPMVFPVFIPYEIWGAVWSYESCFPSKNRWVNILGAGNGY